MGRNRAEGVVRDPGLQSRDSKHLPNHTHYLQDSSTHTCHSASPKHTIRTADKSHTLSPP